MAGTGLTDEVDKHKPGKTQQEEPGQELKLKVTILNKWFNFCKTHFKMTNIYLS